MEIRYETRMKRFCEGNTELLRVIVSYPQTGDYESFDHFYKELAERSLAFGEEKLFLYLLERHHALSEHDRKFRAQKRVYRVACEAEVMGKTVNVTLTAELLLKNESESRHCESQSWEIYGKEALMVPRGREKRKKCGFC